MKFCIELFIALRAIGKHGTSKKNEKYFGLQNEYILLHTYGGPDATKKNSQ
jgi:hypothetical protein